MDDEQLDLVVPTQGGKALECRRDLVKSNSLKHGRTQASVLLPSN